MTNDLWQSFAKKVFIMISVFVLAFGNYNESEDFQCDSKDVDEPFNYSSKKDVI